MRKLSSLLLVVAVGIGLGGQPRANSVFWQVLSGNPRAMFAGQQLVVSMIYEITTDGVTAAVTSAELVGGDGALIVRAAQTTTQAWGDSFLGVLSSFDLTSGGAAVGANCATSGRADVRTCVGPPYGDGARFFGGVSLNGVTPGTHSIGTLTIEMIRPGATVLTSSGRWENFGNEIIPSSRTLHIAWIPEPGTAGLIGLGLVGLVHVRRRHD